MGTLLVRLKAHDPRRGYVLRRFAYAGIRFDAGQAWTRVDEAVADYLRGVHSIPGDPSSPLAFEVATEQEAAKLEAAPPARSGRGREATSEPGLASVLTTADLPQVGAAEPDERSGRRSSSKRGRD